jgi:hypothetical protein
MSTQGSAIVYVTPVLLDLLSRGLTFLVGPAEIRCKYPMPVPGRSCQCALTFALPG